MKLINKGKSLILIHIEILFKFNYFFGNTMVMKLKHQNLVELVLYILKIQFIVIFKKIKTLMNRKINQIGTKSMTTYIKTNKIHPKLVFIIIKDQIHSTNHCLKLINHGKSLILIHIEILIKFNHFFENTMVLKLKLPSLVEFVL